MDKNKESLSPKICQAVTDSDIKERMWRNLEFGLAVRGFLHEGVKPIVKKYNLKTTDIMTILLIGSNKSIKTATDISRHSDLKRGNISIIIDNLMKRGYVEQETVPDDRRQKTLHLTDKSKDILAECMEVIRRMIGVLIEGIPSTNLEVCDGVLRVMEGNMIKSRRQVADATYPKR